MENFKLCESHNSVLKNFLFIKKQFIDEQEVRFRPGQSVTELYLLALCVEFTKNLNSDLAEVGVYSGGSANIINHFKNPTQKLYLFDTFEGLKDCQENDRAGLVWNGLANANAELGITLELLKERFAGQNIEIIQGYFPEIAPQSFTEKKFSFVHLDTDTYISTLNGLRYFYPKLEGGGIIIVHDYVNKDAPGVVKAVDEFVRESSLQLFVPGGESTQAIMFKP